MKIVNNIAFQCPHINYAHRIDDTPPSSLMNTTSSPKVKTTEGEGVKACSLARSTTRVEGHVEVPRWD
jgi:hypothetical protein